MSLLLKKKQKKRGKKSFLSVVVLCIGGSEDSWTCCSQFLVTGKAADLGGGGGLIRMVVFLPLDPGSHSWNTTLWDGDNRWGVWGVLRSRGHGPPGCDYCHRDLHHVNLGRTQLEGPALLVKQMGLNQPVPCPGPPSFQNCEKSIASGTVRNPFLLFICKPRCLCVLLQCLRQSTGKSKMDFSSWCQDAQLNKPVATLPWTFLLCWENESSFGPALLGPCVARILPPSFSCT